MDLRTAITAFAFRGARRGAVAQTLATSGGLALVLVLIAAWSALPPAAPPYYQPPDGCLGPDFACGVSYLHATLGLADAICLGLVALLGLVVAPAAVAAAVAQERRAGTLDQLRTTPLSPLALATGLVVGAPLRVYLLAAGPLALHLALGIANVVPLSATLLATALLATGTLASVAIGLAVALAPRQEGAAGGFLALATAVVLGGAGLITCAFTAEPRTAAWGYLHPLGALHAAMSEPEGVWRHLFYSSWARERFTDGSYTGTLAIVPLASCVAALGLAALLARAACRKIARPELPLFTKAQVLTLFLGVAVGVQGPFAIVTDDSRVFGGAMGTLLLLVPLGALLLACATPTAEAWALGLRSARPATGRSWLGADAEAPLVAGLAMTVGLAGLVLLVAWRDRGGIRESEAMAAVWLLVLSAGLPSFVQLLATRYGQGAGRWGFAAATCVFVVGELASAIAVASRAPNLELAAVQGAGLLLVAAPLLVAWRQRGLVRRILTSRV